MCLITKTKNLPYLGMSLNTFQKSSTTILSELIEIVSKYKAKPTNFNSFYESRGAF